MLTKRQGQNGLDTERLKDFCDTTALDYITLAFVNRAPKSVGDLPGTNFAAHCAGIYYEDSMLQSSCDWIRQDIKYCQGQGKKILLSIGGVFTEENVVTKLLGTASDYSLPDNETGEWFAEYLWGAFGPKTDDWAYERPFDYDDVTVEVDGFDFDIEHNFADQQPYVKCVNKLRELSSGHGKVLTAAPQCPVGDDNEYMYMRDILKGATFDKIFIQFYNNGQCEGSNFNLDAWVEWLSTTRNSEAELFIGLQAIEDSVLSSGFVQPEDIAALISAAQSYPTFGGVMLWDAHYATLLTDSSDKSYLSNCASAIGKAVTTITTSTATYSATTSSSSSVATSSTVITTSSSAAATTTTSSSEIPTSTSSSASSSITESSTASTSSVVSTSSEVVSSSSTVPDSTSSYAFTSSATVTSSSDISSSSSASPVTTESSDVVTRTYSASSISSTISSITESSTASTSSDVVTSSSTVIDSTSSYAATSSALITSSSDSVTSSSSSASSSSSESSIVVISTYSASPIISSSASSSIIPTTSSTASSSAAITSSASLPASYSQSVPATTSASTSTDDDDVSFKYARWNVYIGKLTMFE